MAYYFSGEQNEVNEPRIQADTSVAKWQARSRRIPQNQLLVVIIFLVATISVEECAVLGFVSTLSKSSVDPTMAWLYKSDYLEKKVNPSFLMIPTHRTLMTTTRLCAVSMKPAAEPLLASGKALAYSGELLIGITEKIGLYGGALSAAGANLRNAGDSVAQAAASCRFKTGMELVIDELREAGTCLLEGRDKLETAIDEARIDPADSKLVATLQASVGPMEQCGTSLEQAGKGIMIGAPINEIGQSLSNGGEALRSLSELILELGDHDLASDTQLCSQRMKFAADQMILAGQELQGIKKEKPKGKSWLKG